ncbi:SAM-dependent methyltransferase [Shewanella algicola]|uniref:Methyltransferase domain-containing protein n=1 Tax=Shewanella algicola TaxID=640633 RepID=A0A9X1ZDD0_9GAMM|nr:methyltransferase domain-containing protein [Shewanella algicola]MCL1106520.1 methyltransferase domain-containing protein [Shewanella algicola]GGP59630.1 SAM-dependent methyltransferase [Shewanella algicola]
MTLPLLCPVCATPLKQHQASQGFFCDNKHHFDKHAQGYWPLLSNSKTKPQVLSRQQMRGRHFLLESGLFAPLITQLQTRLLSVINASSDKAFEHLDYQCANGYYLRQLVPVVAEAGVACEHWGITDAENAIFAAAKAQTPAKLILAALKKLPFATQSMDVVTVFDSLLKGKECIRVLKDDGRILMLQPGVRHLWQIKQQVYPDLVEKPLQLNLPNELEIESQQQVSFTQSVAGEQALTLLEMSVFGWRANDELKHKIKATAISELEFDWQIITLKKRL